MVSLIPNIQVSSVMTWLFWGLIVLLVVGGIGYFVWYTIKRKRYNEYSVEILDKDGMGNVYKTFDRGGVFVEKKTGQRLFFIEKGHWGGNPNKIPYISSVGKKGRLIKTVTLRRIGVNNYVFVDITLGESLNVTIGEEDLNNQHNEAIKIRHTYNKESWLSKLAPYITVVIGMVILMILMLNLGNKFTIMETISQNLLEVSNTQTQLIGIFVNMTNATIQHNEFNSQLPIVKAPGGG